MAVSREGAQGAKANVACQIHVVVVDLTSATAAIATFLWALGLVRLAAAAPAAAATRLFQFAAMRLLSQPAPR